MKRTSRWSASLCAFALIAGAAVACPPGSEPPSMGDGVKPSVPQQVDNGLPEWMQRFVPEVDSPAAKAYAKAQKTRQQTEKELKQLRAKYFRQTRNVETRQVGFSKLHEYTDPALYPTLIEIFGTESPDVRDALLDHFASMKSDPADASLTWCAVMHTDKAMRQAATTRIQKRVAEVGKASYSVQTIIATGLKQNDNAKVAAAAQLASALKLYEAIPMMISAQVAQSGGPAVAADGGEAALAYILVGQQQTFVSDLTPVVGDSAVGFDPELSVLTEGTIMRIIDAVVITYRTEVHIALVDLSTQGWGGQSTAQLGWNNNAWREWYAKEFVPYRKQVDAQKAAQQANQNNKPL